MLRSFRLGNHRSFREEQELLLMPGTGQQRGALPVTAVYGANASGKSNLLDGLRFMRSAVRDSFSDWDALDGVPRTRFRLAPDSALVPSVFVAEFVTGGEAYTYGFAVDDERVLEEWLYAYPKKKTRVVFEREGGEVKFGSTLAEPRAKLDVLEDMTRSNALLLSVAVQSNIEFATPVYRFFSQELVFAHQRRSVSSSVRYVARDDETRRKVVDLLRAADLGITDVVAEEVEDPTWRRRAEQAERELKRAEEAGSQADVVRWRERYALIRDRVGATVHRIKLVHGDPDEPFDVEDESQGTQSWLRLIPTALTVLDQGSVLLVDEIDSSLHPLLTARLIGLFRDERTNPHAAQLLFTTHDTSLLGTMLDDEVLHRDEVWFVRKAEDGASELYPLSDFKPRKGENTERRYLRGSYGAVPELDHADFVAAVGSRR
ncbi:AAA family ATPase [Saccharopolyspora sp. CA-218241]|uniref:AAA family ATPase n=1 Tax=Saccharopolyspora sp. CA-218241 TaxID=3240027 RepID=UPI003D9693C4